MSVAQPRSVFARVAWSGATHYLALGAAPAEGAALLDAPPWAGGKPTGARVPGAALTSGDARYLYPVVPTKIIGIGRNYRAHAAELNNAVPEQPLMFLKPPSSLSDPGAPVFLPRESQRVDYEGELAVIIGRRCRRVAHAEALGCIFGYGVACDVTARDLQRADAQWTRGKGFDTFCPLGAHVVSGVDAADLELELLVNGERRQHGRTSDMIFDLATLVAYASSVMTLEPGDLILTGTPEGVGPLAAGDQVQIRVQSVGELAFGVENERGS
jgi:2-keto-4-pentenoate hydratase/2-oxohepta-3-ene-1,7-dioic acid hydratase in catechol pathway